MEMAGFSISFMKLDDNYKNGMICPLIHLLLQKNNDGKEYLNLEETIQMFRAVAQSMIEHMITTKADQAIGRGSWNWNEKRV